MMQPDADSPEAPSAPLLVYDGQCGFCRAWIDYWKQITHGIEYAPYHEVKGRFPDIPEEKFAAAVQLILPNKEVREGAHAVFILKPDPEGHQLLGKLVLQLQAGVGFT